MDQKSLDDFNCAKTLNLCARLTLDSFCCVPFCCFCGGCCGRYKYGGCCGRYKYGGCCGRYKYGGCCGRDEYGEKLLNSGFTVYKYAPYGSFIETYPYLLRRLYENYDVLKYALYTHPRDFCNTLLSA
jgi:hypothetical protein